MSNRKTKKTIIVLLLIIFAAALAYVIYSTVIKKSSTELYLDAESRNFEKIVNKVGEYHSAFINKQKPYIESVNRSRTELTADITGGAEIFGLEDSGQVSEIVRKAKLVIDTRRQPQKGISATEASLLLEKAPFLNAELFTDNNTIWAAVPDFMPGRYFSVERDNLSGLYDRFDIPVKPLEMVTGTKLAYTLVFDRDPFMASAKKLGSIFTEYFNDKTVAYNGKNAQTIGGKAVEGDEYLITLDEENATSLFKELLMTVSEDDVLLKHAYGNYANMTTLLDNAGMFQLFGYMDETGTMTLNDDERKIVDILGANKDIDAFRSQLRQLADDYRVKGGMKMKVVIDKDLNILYREVVLDINNTRGATSYRVDVNSGSSNTVFEDARNRFVKLTVEEYGNDSANGSAGSSGNGLAGKITELSIVPAFEKTSGSDTDTTGKVDIMYAVTGSNGIRNQTAVSLDISGGIDQALQRINKTIKLTARISGETGEGSIIGTLDNSSWSNKKLNTSNNTTNISFNADLPFLGVNDFSARLDISDEDSFGIEDFSLPDMNNEAVTDLYKASDDELENLQMEVMASFGAFYLNNKYIFDALLGQ